MISVAPAPDTTPTTPASTWRDRYPVHPCADVFPMMTEPEIDALAADIKANGQRQPVVKWIDQAGTHVVIDGRNRLAACERAGLTAHCVMWVPPDGGDPAAYVISANIRRRHLTKEQQAELIVRTIEAAKSIDRAKPARSFNTKAGKKGGSTKDRVLTQAVEEGQKVGISKRTIQNARAKVQGKQPAPRSPKTTATGSKPTTSSSSTQTRRQKTPSPDLKVVIVGWTHRLDDWEAQLRAAIPYMDYVEEVPAIAIQFRASAKRFIETLSQVIPHERATA